MIGIFEALDWLNAIDGNSCLTDTERGLSMAARVVSNPEDQFRRIHNRLQNIAQRSGDRDEIAEVTLHLAAIEYWREWYVEAVQNTTQAIGTYRNDNHRCAVAQWMLGLAQWRISENDDAFTNWREARQTFQDRQSEFHNSPNLCAWYEAWTWQMDLELIAKPEEIFTWLNQFAGDPTSLSPSSAQLVGSIVESIRQRRYSQIYTLIRDIQQINQWSTVIYERAEVFLECGLAAYQIGNLDFAGELLKRAMLDFAPGLGNNHKQVVARCMLGAVEWLKPDCRNQASVNWRRCIEEFAELMLRADQRNDQLTRQWYADRIALLEAALSERLPGGTPQGRKPRSPNPPAPGPNPAPQPEGSGPAPSPAAESPSPQTGAPGQTGSYLERYEYLCNLVGGDRATADRLIEYERRQTPNASQRDLVERAIQRILDDRR